MKQWLALVACLAPFACSLGCGQAHPAPPPDRPAKTPLPSLFDPAATGTIRGKVVWTSELPSVPPFEVRTVTNESDAPVPRKYYDNPNAPSIDPTSKAVAGAVVYLRKVEPRLAHPWDYPPIVVEHRDRHLCIMEGQEEHHVGFVHQESAVTLVSHEKLYNSLHGRGAAFFSLPFPDPDRPLSRVMKEQGIVELSSGAGYFWMRAYLFVSDHPYVARTDAKGGFDLRQVPPGRYEIVCWLPNWQIKTRERDPETGLVTRLFFQPPLQEDREAVVEAGGDSQVDFSIKGRAD